MIIPKPIEIYSNLAIEFEDFKDVFLPRLLDFATQKATLKQQNNKNEKAFESELKSLLKNTFYNETYIGNRPYRKGEADLIIAENKKASSKTAVLIEVKSPLDKKDFITQIDIKRKSFFQAVTYFLTEIVEKQNFNIKNILITNTDDFYLFDAVEFHKLFYKSTLRKDFENWYFKAQSGTSITDFYQQVENFIDNIETTEIEFSHFQFTDNLLLEINEALQTDGIDEFNKAGKFQNLKNAYRFFSPQTLQKEKAERDGSELNKKFYNELLYILGLKEYEKNGTRLIHRLPKNERSEGSFIENAIQKIIFERPIHLQEQGEKRFVEQEGDFDKALELCIIWINRILFLKLLEGQLESYHSDKKTFRFLTPEIIKNGNKLATLFFHVLNTPTDTRGKSLQTDFQHIPYLNSSLFQITYIEIIYGRISGLRDDLIMPIFKNTALSDTQNELPPLEYLLLFLDAYNFGEPVKQEVQHKTKDLINASVLGKIFEKLNGYKDGSFYTPSYITMYMSRKVVRNAIVRKFNEQFELDASNFDEIKQFTKSKYKTEDIERFNKLVNEITVCDPAVGSGHFLVSVLNELICAKSELEILYDDENQALQYWIGVENDELKIYNKRIAHQEFEYKTDYKNGIRTVAPELQKVQTTLFREKQNFIENSLYGVDVNPNSVQICRLRLWIELLKNAYYTPESNFQIMETLPNLDYKIVEGNSLVPVYENQPIIIDWKRKRLADNIRSISQKIATINQSVDIIRDKKQAIFHVKNYNKEISLVSEINRAKANLLVAKFEIEILQIDEILNSLDPEQRLDKQLNRKEEKQRNELLEKKAFLQKIKREIDYSPDLGKPIVLFDWNIDFAEIIGTFQNGNGNRNDYGFDIVIGNPPYGMVENEQYKELYKATYQTVEGRVDLYEVFIEKGLKLTKKNGELAYIIPNTLFSNLYAKKLRNYMVNNFHVAEISNFGMDVFEMPTVHTAIVRLKNELPDDDKKTEIRKQINMESELEKPFDYSINQKKLSDNPNNTYDIFFDPKESKILEKISEEAVILGSIYNIRQCIKTGDDEKYVKSSEKELGEPWKKTLKGKSISRYATKDKHLYLKYGNWLARNWQNTSFYETPKIVVRETGNEIIATLDLENRYLLSSLYSVYPIEEKTSYQLKYVLAILNSDLGTYYISKIALDLTKGSFTKFRTNQLARLPIKTIIKAKQKPIIELVDKTLSAKQQKQDTKELENQLNKMVYQLYEISKTEQEEIETILMKRKIK